MKQGWYRYDPGRQLVSVTLHVQPNASKSSFAGLHGDALKVRIAAPAADNKANSALIEFLSTACRVPKAAITIRHGAAGRRKVVEISGGPAVLAGIQRLI